MASALPNPALDAFVAQIGPEIVFAQVLVRKVPEGFELTHVADRGMSPLRSVTKEDLRDVAQFTSEKLFRPLKSAPTLERGWRFVASDASELNDALQCLYPGAIADWFASRSDPPPVTHYRAFTARQTGMYRITAALDDVKVEQLARAGCAKEFCLKQRLWSVEDSRHEHDTGKSIIPCLEPCAVLLEFARTIARIEQQESPSISLTSGELETCAAALEQLVRSPNIELREADFSAPANPRRVQLLLDKIRAVLGKA